MRERERKRERGGDRVYNDIMRGSQTTITVRLVKARPQDLKIKAIDHEIKTLTTKC